MCRSTKIYSAAATVFATALPVLAAAQGAGNTYATGSSLSKMESMMEGVYASVIQGVDSFAYAASAVGAVGAVIAISMHVSKGLVQGSPIDISGLARPFFILIGLLFYFEILAGINTLLAPTVQATDAMVADENAVVEEVLLKLENARKTTGEGAILLGPDGTGDFDAYLKNNGASDAGWFEQTTLWASFRTEATLYELRTKFRMLVFTLMTWVYTAAVFILNTLRAFTLAVLGLLGPLALGFSLIPGFGSSFTNWAGRYVTVYLWLPVANVFGYIISVIQVQFAEETAAQLALGNTGVEAADGLYFILLLTGVAGYASVPAVTGYFIAASGASGLMSGAMAAGRMALGSATGGAANAAGMAMGAAGVSSASRMSGYGAGAVTRAGAGATARAGARAARASARVGRAVKDRLTTFISPPTKR